MTRYEIKKVDRPIWNSKKCKAERKMQYEVVETGVTRFVASGVTVMIAFAAGVAFAVLEMPDSWIRTAAMIAVVAGVVLLLSLPSSTFSDESFDTKKCAEEYKKYLEMKGGE